MAEPKGIDPRMVRRLADILIETGLTQIEVEQDGQRIRVAREITAAPTTVYASAPQAAPASAAPASPAAAGAAAEAPQRGEQIKSPMVGTIYLQAQPGSDPFVSPGAKVTAGQTLLIIEAMKTMNPITAPRDGVVLDVLVADAQPVEFGEPLVVLE